VCVVLTNRRPKAAQSGRTAEREFSTFVSPEREAELRPARLPAIIGFGRMHRWRCHVGPAFFFFPGPSVRHLVMPLPAAGVVE